LMFARFRAAGTFFGAKRDVIFSNFLSGTTAGTVDCGRASAV
jgi:hypothetical protein